MAVTRRIRMATREDLPEILGIYAPYVENTVISFEYAPPSAEAFLQRFEHFTAEFAWLVCEAEGRIAGYSYAHRYAKREAFKWSAECSIYVHPDFTGQKIGKALYSCLIEILRLQGYCNALGSVTVPNPASEAIHAAFGFEPVGDFMSIGYKKGAWRTVRWYALPLGAYPEEPVPPKPIGEVLHTEAFRKILAAGTDLLK